MMLQIIQEVFQSNHLSRIHETRINQLLQDRHYDESDLDALEILIDAIAHCQITADNSAISELV
jgi:hypothetical protein